MEEKLYELYLTCLEELHKIGINMYDIEKIGKIDISISKRKNKRYGCCKQEKPDVKFKIMQKRGNRKILKYEKFNVHHIEISSWVMRLNDEIIKNTIIHELIHCIPFCNNHGAEFKKYALYINKKLGYEIKRVGDPKKDYKNSNLEFSEKNPSYKYKIRCQNCNQNIYRQRFNIRRIKYYRCGKCGGELELI